jgi:hypothetical protein
MALILRIHIQNAVRKHDMNVLRTRTKEDTVNRKTVNEPIRTLSMLMAVGNTIDWKPTAVSRNVGEILSLLGSSSPKSGHIIIG